MAEDAAGAVRRTPRLGIDDDADRWRDANGRANARIAELRQQLAAVDDALHGLDSDLGDDAPLAARVKELHESYLDALELNGRWIDEISQLKRDRDLALWLHAELKHKLDLPCGSCHPCAHWAEETWRREGRSVPHFHDWQALVAERDALQARIDAALALMDYWDEHGGSIPQGHRLRAALQGDQPTDACSGCWETGNDVEPEIGGVATVSVSGWPAGVPHVWLRVDSYAYKNEGADVVLQPDEADEIASFLSSAARAVRRDRAEPTGEVDRG